jgi:hypothetical protein
MSRWCAVNVTFAAFSYPIRSYFTRINRQWLHKMVAHRIADLNRADISD